MRLKLIILFFFYCLVTKAQTYYVDFTTGNDGNPGTTMALPWKTVAKVNATSFSPGAIINFKRGEVWNNETLTPSSSGTAGNPITYGSYGSGNKPLINGWTTLSSWTNLGSNKWEKTINAGTFINMVTVNGVVTAMGRYPNYPSMLVYDNSSANTNIIDNDLPTSPSYAGATVVLRSEAWAYDLLTNITHAASGGGSILSSATPYSLGNIAHAGNSYFIQNLLSLLDQNGEWYYTPSTKITIYSTTDPGSTVRIATSTDNCSIISKSYITIDGIRFEGSKRAGIWLSNVSNIKILNCDQEFAGQNGAGNYDNQNLSSSNPVSDLTVDNSIFRNNNADGLYIGGPSHSNVRITTTNNVIRNSGMIVGTSWGSDQQDGLFIRADGVLVQYNDIDSCGGGGLQIFGQDWLVKNNLVQHWNGIIDDIGGLYTSHVTNGDPGPIVTGRRVIDNIVINGMPMPPGKGSSNTPQCEGIYFDEPATNNLIQGNTVANVNHNGLMNHYTDTDTIRDNTVYNCGGAQLGLWNEGGTSLKIENMQIKNNILVAGVNSYLMGGDIPYSENQMTFQAFYHDASNSGTPSPEGQDPSHWGVLDSNWHISPYTTSGYMRVEAYNSGRNSAMQNYYNLPVWKTKFPTQDQHSNTAPVPRTLYKDVTTTGSNKATTTSFSSSNFFDFVSVGTITAGKQYLVKFTSQSTSGSNHGDLRVLMNDNGPSFIPRTDKGFGKLLTTSSNEEFILTCNFTTSASLYFYCHEPAAHSVSGIDVREITAVTFPTYSDSVILVYNATKNPITLDLTGSHYWRDYKYIQYADAITLQPYKSSVLFMDTGTVIPNIPPVANAGPDKTITWPTNSTSATGFYSDIDGTVTGVVWAQISGPNNAVISAPTSASTNFTGLTGGTYLIKFTVTDNGSAMTSDTMQINVNASSAPKITAIFKDYIYDLRGSEGEGGSDYSKLFDGSYDPKNGTTTRGGALDTLHLFTSVHPITKKNIFNSTDIYNEIDVDLKINYDVHEIWFYDQGTVTDSLYIQYGDWGAWTTAVSYKTSSSGWKRYFVNFAANKFRISFKNTINDGNDNMAEMTEMVIYGNAQTTAPSAPGTYNGARQTAPTVGQFVGVNLNKPIDSTKWLKPFGFVRMFDKRFQHDTARLNLYPTKVYRENYNSYSITYQAKTFTQTLKNMGIKTYISHASVPQYWLSGGGGATDIPTDKYSGPGLRYKYYEDATISWTVLPNFSLLTPRDTGYVSNIDITQRPVTQNDYFAYLWEGYVNIPAAGTWTFEIVSDDGSKLYFDQFYSAGGTPLVSNDGIHPASSQSNSVIVNTAGKHPIAISYFEAFGGQSFEVYWTGPGVSRQLIPNSAFSQGYQDQRDKENFKTDSMYMWLRAALYGNTSHATSEFVLTDVTEFAQNNTMDQIQIGNEASYWGNTTYQDPVSAAAQAIKVYGGIKAADINSKMIMSPTAKPDTNYIKVLNYGLAKMGDTTKHYFNAAAIHNYIFKGANEFPATDFASINGELPEKYNMLSGYIKIRNAAYKYAGNIPFYIDEIGWSRNATNPYNTPLIRTLDGPSSQGCLLVKSLNYGIFAGIDRMAVTTLVNDVADGGSGIYDAMGLLTEGAGNTVGAPTEAWYWVATYANVLKNFKPVSFDTTGTIWKFKYVNINDADSAAWFFAAKDTATTVTNYALNIGTTITGLARLIEFVDNRDTGFQTLQGAAGNIVTITSIGYIPKMILVKEGVPPNIPPTALAGPDKSIQLPVTNSSAAGGGNDPDGTITGYLWTQQSGPVTGIISAPNSANTNFTGLTVAGTYTFRLRVTDNNGAQATDDMNVVVLPANVPPHVNAGADKTITLPTNSTTVAGTSFDDDGTIASVSWQQISGPNTAIIGSPNSPTTNITGMVQGNYFFKFTAFDNQSAQSSDTMKVTVNQAGNQSPNANAGPNITIHVPTAVTVLNGSASSDPDGTIVAYLWTKISGPNSFNIVTPSNSITTVNGLVPGTYVFTLTVTDNNGSVNSDNVTVIVNNPPTANAGNPITVDWPIATTQLHGAGVDTDGTIASYSWTKLSGPTFNITNATVANPTLSNLQLGVYLFQLTVTDNDGGTGTATVTVTVAVPTPHAELEVRGQIEWVQQ